RKGVACACRIGAQRERGNARGDTGDVDRRAARAVCDDDLRHRERGDVAQHLGFLVSELQNLNVLEYGVVVVRVEPYVARLGRAHEAAAVEQDAAAAGDPRDRLGRGV